MKISFLVTYYNQEQYVRQSLDSILAIDKPCDWEILVGDDGSQDGTIDAVSSYIQKYPENIFLYRMPREEGKHYDSVRRASANRLNLLHHTTGDYFCVLDGDDWYIDRQFISDAIEIFESPLQASVVAFCFKHYNGSVAGDSNYIGEGLLNKREYIRRAYTPAGACVFQMPSQEQMKILDEVGYYDDNDILLFQLNFGEIYAINRAIYAYRQTDDSVYNSMSLIEQFLLNAQGFDIDRLYLPDYFRDVLKRYGSSLWGAYKNRQKMPLALGERKYQELCESWKSFPDSYSYIILTWNEAGRAAHFKVYTLLLMYFREAAVSILEKLKKKLFKHR